MYRVAVCDDVNEDLLAIAGVTVGLLNENGIEFDLQQFPSAAALMDSCRSGQVWDLILLDIIMDGQNGIELADTLRADGNETDLVFVTSSPEYALAGYHSYPVSYLLKPLTREKLNPVLSRCLQRRQGENSPCLLVRSGTWRCFGGS